MDKPNYTMRYDILNELFNISVGKAAGILSEIVDKKIVLNVPHLKILDFGDSESELDDALPDVMNGTLMVSSIQFSEQLTGKANLIFPADKMKAFIRLCMDQQAAEKFSDAEFTDLDFDIVKEIGNIVLNCIIGELGNYLNIRLDYTLPEVKVYHRIDLDKDIDKKTYKSVLILYINFIVDGAQIEGAILVDLTMKSIQDLSALLAKIEGSLDE